MAKEFWERIWDEAHHITTDWLTIQHSPDGPIAHTSILQKTVIFPFEPQPPVGQQCEIEVRKTLAGEYLGKWTRNQR